MKDDGLKQPPKNTEPVVVQDVIPPSSAVTSEPTKEDAKLEVGQEKPENTAETQAEPISTETTQAQATSPESSSSVVATPQKEAPDSDEIVPGESQKTDAKQPTTPGQLKEKTVKTGNGVALVIIVSIFIFLVLSGLAVYSQIK